MEDRLIPYQATPSFGMGRILVLAPHPDDEVFGCGGAIVRQVAEGGSSHVIVVTGGDFQQHSSDTQAYAATRQDESRRAGNILGYGNPDFWSLPDRGLEYGEPLVLRIVDAIDAFKPDGVFAPSIYEMHPDHRVLGMAALEAVRRTRSSTKLVMYEVGVPMPRPNFMLDISDLVETKQRAMACFESQLQGQAYDQQIQALNRFRSYTLGPQVHAAEAYRVLQRDELATAPLEVYESEYQRQRSLGLVMVPSDVPLVSVIICSRGSGIPNSALDSVALQTYSNVEVIVTTADAKVSTSLPPTCGRFPMTAMQSDAEDSLAARTNAAMRQSTGKYLMILDDGSQLLPDGLALLVTAIRGSAARAVRAEVESVDQHPDAGFQSESPVLFERSLFEGGCIFLNDPNQPVAQGFSSQIAKHTAIEHIPNTNAARATTPSEPERLQFQTTEEFATQIAGLRNEITELSQTSSRQLAHIHALTNRMEALQNSTSWKVTGPIRSLISALRGNRRAGKTE